MKTVLLLASALLASAASAKPIAILKESGGFCPNQCPSTTLVLDESGALVAETHKQMPTPTVERKLVLTLSRDVVKAIQKDIQGINASELVDVDENQPVCADIPSILYTVVKNGQKIDIGQDRDCHQYRLVDFQGTQLVDSLRNFLSLHFYTQR